MCASPVFTLHLSGVVLSVPLVSTLCITELRRAAPAAARIVWLTSTAAWHSLRLL